MATTTSTKGSTTDPETAHKVLVGILVLLIMLVILTEVAGSSHSAYTIVFLVMLGPLLLLGMNHATQLKSWVATNPYNPK